MLEYSDNPYEINYNDLTVDELTAKQSNIQRRIMYARQLNMDPHIIYQLELLLSSVENESNKRIAVDNFSTGIIIDVDPIDLSNLKSKVP